MVPEGSKEEILERVSRKAGDYEELSVNCAQGTLAALNEEFSLGGGKEVLKAATFMPGLMSRKETCGAVIGGLMALGLAYGRDKLHDPAWRTPEANEEMFRFRNRVWSFCEAFKKEFGSTMCGDIRPQIMGRDYDTMDMKERQQFLKDDGARKCRVPPEKAAHIAAGLLLEE
ncbi:MAG: C_GCAxxG_C_C family protein [Chloroflexi bacterium]|nr:C_GCAxxG_C_C family protein [Chloroflexota bacterium]